MVLDTKELTALTLLLRRCTKVCYLPFTLSSLFVTPWSRSYLPSQGQCFYLHSRNLCLGNNSLQTCWYGKCLVLIVCCPWIKGVFWPWLTMISQKLMPQCTQSQNLCLDCNFSSILDLDKISYICYPWPKVVLWS